VIRDLYIPDFGGAVALALFFAGDLIDFLKYMGERPDAYVEKPIEPAHLLETARRLTGGAD